MGTSWRASRPYGNNLYIKVDPRPDKYMGVVDLPFDRTGIEKTRYTTGVVLKAGHLVLKELGLQHEDELINRRVVFRNYLQDGTHHGIRDDDNLITCVLRASSIEMVIYDDTKVTAV